ncbi:MAG: hypothetical protein LH618_18100, partial [Saprospiraceae bacterium]|nr:hypothetical protein [Saprospiraceae bacterium]
KLAKVNYYPELFQAAFGTSAITEDRIADALSQFVCAISTTNSRFDQEAKTNFAGFTTLEKMGQDLFLARAPIVAAAMPRLILPHRILWVASTAPPAALSAATGKI